MPKSKIKEPIECGFNHGVLCGEEGDKCKMCGWNPDIFKIRMREPIANNPLYTFMYPSQVFKR